MSLKFFSPRFVDFHGATLEARARDQVQRSWLASVSMLRHQYLAIALFGFMSLILLLRHGIGEPWLVRVGLLLVTLLLVLFHRQLASVSRFGFWQYFASDFRSGPHTAPFLVLAWLIFLLTLAAQYFEWSVY